MNHLVVSAGAYHIYLWPQEIQPREREKKNEKKQKNKTNELYGLGLTQVQEEWFRDTAFLCICRLTPTCILLKISTKPRGMLTHLDWSSLTAPGPYLMSTGLFRCPSSTALLRHSSPTFCRFLLQLLSDRRSRAHFWSRRDLELRPLFGFAPKQTKRLSA